MSRLPVRAKLLKVEIRVVSGEPGWWNPKTLNQTRPVVHLRHRSGDDHVLPGREKSTHCFDEFVGKSERRLGTGAAKSKSRNFPLRKRFNAFQSADSPESLNFFNGDFSFLVLPAVHIYTERTRRGIGNLQSQELKKP